MAAGFPANKMVRASLILLIALAIGAFNLDSQSLWYDEAFSVRFAQRHCIPDVFIRAAQLDLNTALHYALLKGWMAGLGESEFAVRLLSVFAGIISVALAHRLSGVVLGQPSTIPAMLIVLSPVCILAAQETRMYALAGCLCLGATLALLLGLRDDRPALWLAWGALGILAFATHVLCALVIGIHIVVGAAVRLNIRRTISRPQRLVMAGVVLVIFMWTAFIWPNRADYGVSYDAPANWLTLVVQTAAGQALPRLLPAEWVAPVGVAVIVALGLSCIVLRRASTCINLTGPTGTLAGITVGALIAMATFCAVVGKFSPRYPSILAPITLTTISIALASMLRHRRVVQAFARAGLAALVVGFSGGAFALRSNSIYANEDFRGAVAYIRANLQPDERVLLVSGHFAPAFEYYWTGPTDAWIALPPDPVLDVRNTLTYTSVVPLTNAALAGMGGAWLLLWQDDVIDPTGVVPTLLRRQAQALAPLPHISQFAGLRLEHYRFFHPYRRLPEQIPPSDATIEHNRPEVGLRSLGCIQPQPAYVGDGFMEIQCFWQTRPFVPLSVYTKVSLRLTDAQGNQIAQFDQPIAFKGFPYVPYEKPIWGVHFIPLPADVRPGDYTLRVVPYTEAGEISPQVSLPMQILAR